LIALFLGAVIIEMIRRRASRRAQIAAEWQAVDEVLGRKDFSDEQRDLLYDLIRRRAPEAPLEAVTTQRRFEACVEQEMGALEQAGDIDRFQEIGVRLREMRVGLGLDFAPAGQRIFSTRQLRPGQPVWRARTSGAARRWVKGNVSAMDETYFYVTLREDLGVQAANSPGEIRRHLWREDDARYECTIVPAGILGPPATRSFLHTTDLRRVQSRNYYRVRCNQETTIGILSRFSERERPGVARRILTRIPGRILSLGAGGLAVLARQSVPRRADVQVVLALPGEEPFDADASIVSVEPLSGNEYLVRASFVITEDQRDVIARYVLHRQQPKPEPEKPADASE
jgi:hypothetical protein